MRFGEFSERFREVMATTCPGVTVAIGERHNPELSAPPWVWVTPEGRSSWARPIKMSAGQSFEIKHAVTIRVWGPETVADTDRWDAADDLVDFVTNVVDRVTACRAEPTEFSRPDASVQSYGEQYALTFTLSRGVPKLRETATLPLLPQEPASPPDPWNPTGETGTVTVTITDEMEG